MTNADRNDDRTAKTDTPDHQRKDQPLKELNDDPKDAENATDK